MQATRRDDDDDDDTLYLMICKITMKSQKIYGTI